MKTEQLIRALAADEVGPKTPLALGLSLALLPGFALSLLFYAAVVGPRPHLLALMSEPRILFKLVFPWLVALCAVPTVLRLVRPGADARFCGRLLIGLALVLAAAVVTELLVVAPVHWEALWIGHNALVCMVLIPTMALGPLIAALIVLRRGAPDNPALAGAAAGLLAAALGAGLYATHCPDDSPLFVACWYSLATLVVVAIGAAAGSRWLRW